MIGPQRDRPLRVVMLIPYDLYYQPFTIRSSMFARELARRGHQVRVFYRPMRESKRGNRVHFELPPGCEVQVHPRMKQPRSWKIMADVIRDADVVHFQKSLPPYPQVALWMGRRFAKPVHQDWDDYEFAFWCQAARDRWKSSDPFVERVRKTARAVVAAMATGSAEWLIPKLVDTMGAASMFLRQKSLEWGCDPADLFPARVGVDAEKFHPGRRDEALREKLGLRGPTVLFAGSFDVHPDLVFFAEALKVLFRESPDAQALIVGGGFGRNRLVELLGKGLPERAVVMTEGLVPFEDMPRYVASADVAALPFRDTPVNRCKSSLTMMECMASGLPVVTHDVGDAGWILGDGGIIAPLGDAQAFGAALAGLANDPKRRGELGKKGRSRATEKLTWEKSVDYLEAAYYHGLAKKNGRSA
jgi:glycosyltransferase involved in cell wall biosynthesis